MLHVAKHRTVHLYSKKYMIAAVLPVRFIRSLAYAGTKGTAVRV